MDTATNSKSSGAAEPVQQVNSWSPLAQKEPPPLGTSGQVLDCVDHQGLPDTLPDTSGAKVGLLSFAKGIKSSTRAEVAANAADGGPTSFAIQALSHSDAFGDAQRNAKGSLGYGRGTGTQSRHQQMVSDGVGCPMATPAAAGPRLNLGKKIAVVDSGQGVKRVLKLKRVITPTECADDTVVAMESKHSARSKGENVLHADKNSELIPPPQCAQEGPIEVTTCKASEKATQMDASVHEEKHAQQQQRQPNGAAPGTKSPDAGADESAMALPARRLRNSWDWGELSSPTPTSQVFHSSSCTPSRKRHSKVGVLLPCNPSPIDFSSITTHMESKYEVGTKISEGTYGEVYIGRCRATGAVVALKRLKVLDGLEGFPITSLREVIALQHINKARQKSAPQKVNGTRGNRDEVDVISEVVGLHDVLLSSTHHDIYLVFPYASCSVAGLLQRRYPITEREIAYIFRNILVALTKLHDMGIIHRDVKADNVLIHGDAHVQLGDFGLCVFEGSGRRALTPSLINLHYRPPEMLLGAAMYDVKVDIWSVGCFLAQMYLQTPPFSHAHRRSTAGTGATGKAKADAAGLNEPQQEQKRRQNCRQQRAETELEQLSFITEVLGPLSSVPATAFPPEQCHNYEALRELRRAIIGSTSWSAFSPSITSLFEPSFLYTEFRGFGPWFTATAQHRRRRPEQPIPSRECVDVLEAIFQLDPRKRPTAAQLLKMPFFDLTKRVSCTQPRGAPLADKTAEVQAKLCIMQEMASKLKKFEGSHLAPAANAA
uniref:Uncharacterized protein TCIL3000_11_12940 n=1 Tax=Trypanosoma congolense (strain IL3000) TaxID=1068625 RepID=G0V2C4_TRYCI|nr:unnamed protein product [Trypanosoma congolense IL3000]